MRFTQTAQIICLTTLAASSGAQFPVIEQARFDGSDTGLGARFGISVSVSDHCNWVIAGAWRHNLQKGAAYVHSPAPGGWREYAVLTGSDVEIEDWFGWSVAIDGNTAVVGAPATSVLHNMAAGEAYVFTWDGSKWNEEAQLVASDASPRDRFGFAVAIDDGTIVISSIWDDELGPDSGSAYVFRKAGGIWQEEAKLLPSFGGPGQLFGYSCAVEGNTIIVGMPQGNYLDNVQMPGAAFVFQRTGTVWLEEARLLASDGQPDDVLGISVDISGSAVAVGAAKSRFNICPTCQVAAGAVYVFRHVGSTWPEEQKLRHSDIITSDMLGFSVSLHGNALVAGAPQWGPFGHGGKVFAFAESGGTWTEVAGWEGTHISDLARFGEDVSLAGDVVAVGAPRDHPSGSCFVYSIRRHMEVYCTAKLNSCGTRPTVSFGGVGSATADCGLVLSVKNAKAGKNGLGLYSDSGRASFPFHGGLLCVSPPLWRTIPLFEQAGSGTNCDGALFIDMNAFASGKLGGAPAPVLRMPGTQVNYQFWARDTVQTGPLLSDAMEYVVGP